MLRQLSRSNGPSSRSEQVADSYGSFSRTLRRNNREHVSYCCDLWERMRAYLHFCPAVTVKQPQEEFVHSFYQLQLISPPLFPHSCPYFYELILFKHFSTKRCTLKMSSLVLRKKKKKKAGSKFHQECLWYKMSQMKLLGRRARSSLFHQVDVYISVTFMTSCGVLRPRFIVSTGLSWHFVSWKIMFCFFFSCFAVSMFIRWLPLLQNHLLLVPK